MPTDYANSAWANDRAVCPPYLTEIIEDFPELNTDDISACLRFAANREHDLASVKAL
ncbi:MAG: hypothetical protein Q8Q54_04370 [Methylococcales bacterium]|nr:hypothetical protein [Methylococcales bacterium]MDP3838137.1 hypothetical protein [Methylococcales bacterium]